jgi:hypothetical protein
MIHFIEDTWPLLWVLAMGLILRWFHVMASGPKLEEPLEQDCRAAHSLRTNPHFSPPAFRPLCLSPEKLGRCVREFPKQYRIPE